MDRIRLYVSYKAFTPQKGFRVIVGVTVAYVIFATWFLYVIMCDSVLLMVYNQLTPGTIKCDDRCPVGMELSWTEPPCE